LIGALCFGYIAWEAFRYDGTLPYGYLLKTALTNPEAWSSFPRGGRLIETWAENADEVYRGSFERRWKDTTSEMVSLLRRAVSGIDAGALSIDSQVLSGLGCFDHSTNGAGTVCAAAAAYLASKYAPDPQHGIVEAAFAFGADTDTLASMTSSVLGAVSGSDWLLRFRDCLQDERYIGELADRICEAKTVSEVDDNIQQLSPQRRIREALINQVLASPIGTKISLPDGRDAEVERLDNLNSSSGVSAQQWKLRTIDGQTIYIKRLSRVERSSRSEADSFLSKQVSSKRLPKTSSKVQAVKLPVESIEKSRHFYGELLGLRVTRESKSVVNFGGVITLVPLDYLRELEDLRGGPPIRSLICIETKDIDLCHDRVREDSSARCTPFTEKSGRRLFRCIDPDRNIIEIFEAAQKEPKTDLQSKLL
jgi:catechol 2,3-dioxygenase-like lactoylglutathione lyase family enzyme